MSFVRSNQIGIDDRRRAIIELRPRDRIAIGWTETSRVSAEAAEVQPVRKLSEVGDRAVRILSRAMKIPTPVCLLLLSLFPLLARAYTWQFNSQPRQCQNVSLSVMGSGQPPYNLLIIPYGPTPLPNNTEVRTIQNIPFPGNSNTLTFELNYPENSSFVAVVSCCFLS